MLLYFLDDYIKEQIKKPSKELEMKIDKQNKTIKSLKRYWSSLKDTIDLLTNKSITMAMDVAMDNNDYTEIVIMSRKNWKEIVEIFHKKFNNMHEIEMLIREITNKWVNINLVKDLPMWFNFNNF